MIRMSAMSLAILVLYLMVAEDTVDNGVSNPQSVFVIPVMLKILQITVWNCHSVYLDTRFFL